MNFRPSRPWARRLAAAALVTGGLVASGATAASATTGQPAGNSGVTTITVPLTIISGRNASHGGNAVPDGTGVPVKGDCGTAQLSVRASNGTYDLTLFSTQGVIGSGSYAVSTNGIGAVIPTPGTISGRDSTIWSSSWKSVINAGASPSTATAVGFVNTARDICALVASAPWN